METKLESKAEAERSVSSLFIAVKIQSADKVKKTRQFLAFSDSRNKAALFVCNMEADYNEFLLKRGIGHVIQNNQDVIADRPLGISTLI